ncbi:transforming growth factor beta receptor type 3 [Polypterus senegalus]|uniref:transforming growth factor beta receptor type 3 n=1 Tax=Polypterus senegalus TaxID=55291 RepID=UPI0019652E52|nr:transforming growth factor beta receptor type 3 [Polypterus senegalus]
MAQSQVLVFTLLSLWGSVSAGPVAHNDCILSPISDEHPVRPFLESFTVLSGCASRGTTSLPQEVHIINLRNTEEESSQHGREVTLHLRPISSILIHQKPLAFVLNSPHPVQWKVKTEKLAPGIERTFYVSQGSAVHFDTRNNSLPFKNITENLPHINEDLLAWAEKKFTAVTSFTELKIAENVYIKVGEGPVFPMTCTIEKNFLSLNYLAEYLVPKAAEGCLLSSSKGSRDVHIIELQAPDSSTYSAFQVDITVDVRPLEANTMVHRNLVLILKCEKPVNWVVKSHGVSGNLEVVTSDGCGQSSDTSSFQVLKTKKVKNLPSTAEHLIHWARTNHYSPVTSYTNSPVANHFQVRLSKDEDIESYSVPPMLKVLQNSRQQFGPIHQDGFPFGIPHPLDRDDEDGRDILHSLFSLLPFGKDHSPLSEDVKEPEEAQGSLNVGMTVKCEPDRMLAVVDKESLQANGYTGADLTLLNSTCKAKENQTHYILEAPFRGCDTAFYHHLGSFVYKNAILINQSNILDGSGLPGEYEDMEPSGDNDFPVDQIDSYLSSVKKMPQKIWFNCTSGVPPENSGPSRRQGHGRNPVDNVVFNMDLYNNSLFRYPSQSIITVMENKKIFVEVSITKEEQDLGFLIQTCFISPDSNPSISSDYTIIENVCPKDESIDLYPQNTDFPVPHTQTDKKRFSFILKPKFNVSLLFLHCELTLCTKKEEENSRLVKCIPPDEACISVNFGMIMKMMQHRKTSTKPLVMVSSIVKSTEASTSLPNRNQDKAHATKKPSIVHGLDTPTVVGIAFAAFVIGALLTGALWFIYARTGEATVHKQVPTSPPASENSSAAHSIGSTQSTPCSSSSTA